MTSVAPQQFDFHGQTALVTGGGRGIGIDIASGFASAGADVVICGRNGGRCADVAKQIAGVSGARVLGLPCDVRLQADVDSLIAKVLETSGRIDVLVNNAGTSWGSPVEDHSLEAWEKVVSVNLTGTFLCSQAVGRHFLAAQHGGAIINVSSSAAIATVPPELMNAIAYNSSKGAVISFTRDLAVKWAEHGIRVNAVAPGWFPSDMSREVLRRNESELLKRIPMRRFGGDRDLAGVVLFLASDAAAYVTGQIIAVDGGQSLW